MSDDNNLRNSKTLQTGEASDNQRSTPQAGNNSADNGCSGNGSPPDGRAAEAPRSPIRLQYDVDKPIEISLLVPHHSEEEQLGELRPSMGSDDSIGTVSPLQQSCKNNNEDDYWIRELQRELNKLADSEKQVTDVHYTPSAVIMGSKKGAKEPADIEGANIDQKSPSTCNHSRPRAKYRLILSDNSLLRRQQSDSQSTMAGKKQQEILMKIEVKPRNNTASFNSGDLRRTPSSRHQHTQTEAEQRPTMAARCTQTVESCMNKTGRTIAKPLYGHHQPLQPHRSAVPVTRRAGLQRWGSLQETILAAHPRPTRTTAASSLTNDVGSQAKAVQNLPCQGINARLPPSHRNTRRRLSNVSYATTACYNNYGGNNNGELCNCVLDANGKLYERTDSVREVNLDNYLFDDRYYTEYFPAAREEEGSLQLIQLSGGQDPYDDSSFIYLNGNFTSEVSDVYCMADLYKQYKL